MKSKIMKVLPLVAAIALAACSSKEESQAQSSAESKPIEQVESASEVVSSVENTRFLEFSEGLAKEVLMKSPMSATSLGVTPEYVGEYFNDQLGVASQAEVDYAKDLNSRLKAELAKFDESKLSGTALTTYQLLKNSVGLSESFKPILNGAYGPFSYFTPFTITHISGPQIDIPRSLQTEHPLTSKKDAEDYIARLSQIKSFFEGVAEIVNQDIEKGLILPSFAAEGARSYVDQFLAPAPEAHPLAVSFTARLSEGSDLSEDEVAELTAQVVEQVKTSVYPGYTTLKGALDKMVASASENAGVWDLKNGEELYQLALQNFGAGDKTAEDIHNLGLSEVERIKGEMAKILKAEGYDTSDVIATYNSLSESDEFLYPNTDEGRQALLDDLNHQMVVVTEMLPKILLTLPKAGVEVRRISEFEQDGAPGGYYTSPSLDGSRPGIYWINLKDTADWPKFTLPTLTYHEASPGHHLQVAIAQEISDMPMIRNMIWYSAYGEGWALYAEVLAKEMGLYDTDPLGDLGRLQSELFRAARLVVDTGIHHKHWSREQAIEYMHSAIGGSLASVTREVERYSVWPGQACSYKLGQLTILELREKAKQQLGDKFDLRAFNDQVLIYGAISLPVLRTKINDWLAEQV